MAPIELETEDKLEYTWFPAGSDGVVFRIRASNDAHLALSSIEGETDPMLEVFIGGWKNTKSVIRKNRSKPDVAESDTPDILSASEYKEFWIRWTDNVITVGRQGEAASFLSYDNSADAFPIRFVGLCTGWGATGSWIVEAPVIAANLTAVPSHAVWVGSTGGNVPEGAFVGGDDNGEPLYVARANHEGGLLPGKLVASHGCAYVAWGGGEHAKEEFQVLVGNATWVPCSGDAIPPSALPAGETEDGETLFAGRVKHENTVTTGKVQPSHGVCYISYAGQELGFADYEILTA